MLFAVELDQNCPPALALALKQQHLIVVGEDMATLFGQERTEALDVVAVQPTVLDRAMKCTGWDVVTVLLVGCAMFLERT